MATDRLRHRLGHTCDPALVQDLLVTVYAEEVLELDGVYWDDAFLPRQFSAPRGAINLTHLPDWEMTLKTPARP